MSPRTKKQNQEIKSEKISLIMDVALRLFANKGFDATSVSQIAKEAGISKGLMYIYFQNKEDLLRQVIMSIFTEFFEFLLVKDPENIKKEEILVFVRENFELLKQEPEFYKLYFSLAFQPNILALLMDEIRPVFQNLIDLFTNYFQQKGEEQPLVKARFLIATLDGVGMHYISDPAHFPIEEIRILIENQL